MLQDDFSCNSINKLWTIWPSFKFCFKIPDAGSCLYIHMFISPWESDPAGQMGVTSYHPFPPTWRPLTLTGNSFLSSPGCLWTNIQAGWRVTVFILGLLYCVTCKQQVRINCDWSNVEVMGGLKHNKDYLTQIRLVRVTHDSLMFGISWHELSADL